MRSFMESCAHFRRGLTGEDKLAFDSVMQRAEKHNEGKVTTYKVGKPVQGMEPLEAVFLSIMLEHEKEIRELRNRTRRKDKKEGKRTESGLVHGTLPPRQLHLGLRKDWTIHCTS